MEGEQALIRQLDDMGETAALTPDYRTRVKQVGERYARALVDLREMRVEFVGQLGAELRYHGCRSGELVSRGAEMVASGQDAPRPADGGAIAASGPSKPNRRGKQGEQPAPIVPATTITFYVDNRACRTPELVYLDGALLGEVTAKAKSAFQALAGHHALCLIAGDSAAHCGDPGTLRAAFLHDGWAVRLDCAQPRQP
jgi:hypothetical protein